MSDVEKTAEESIAGKRGEMIAVCSAKGGIGRTVLAVNLAVALSKSNHSKSNAIRIGIMDADFQFGDIALAMDLHSSFTIKDVMESMETMDSFTLSRFLIHHSSGVKVLAAPERPEHAELVRTEDLDKVCDMLLTQLDYLIVDTPVGFGENTLQVIEKADQVFLLTTLEMTAIKNAKSMLETFSLLGIREKVKLVVNRSTMNSVIKATDVPDILGESTPYYIPNDFEVVSQSLNIGVPFVLNNAKTEIAKAVFKMADQLISRREISVFKPKQPSMLQSLLHKTIGTTSIF